LYAVDVYARQEHVVIEDCDLKRFGRVGHDSRAIHKRNNITESGDYDNDAGRTEILRYGQDGLSIRNYAAELDDDHSHVWYCTNASDVYLVDNYVDFDNSYRGATPAQLKMAMHNVLISGNLFENVAGGAGLRVGGYDGQAYDVEVSNNRFVNAERGLDLISSSRNVNVDGNFFANLDYEVIEAGHDHPEGYPLLGVSLAGNVLGYDTPADGRVFVHNRFETYGIDLQFDVTESATVNDGSRYLAGDPTGWRDANGYVDPGAYEYTPPTVNSFQINGGNATTDSRTVTLNMDVVDSGSGMGSAARFPFVQGALMQFSNDGVHWHQVELYSTTQAWTLSEGEGDKTVYARFRDVDGNWTKVVDAGIRYATSDPQNSSPLAVDDHVATMEDVPITIQVLANDIDADGDTLTATLLSDVAHGILLPNGDGSYDYTPDADFNGIDRFTYTVDDGYGSSDSATVSITVDPINDVPAAVDDSAVTGQDTPAPIFAADLLANDLDVDGDALSLTGTTTPGHGVLVDNGDGSFVYSPASGFSGTDAFDYTVSDGHGGGDTGTVTITVTPSALRFYALGDSSVFGVVAGTFADTQASDDAHQTITEEKYGGKKSRLEHVWNFGTVSNAGRFVVEAFHDGRWENVEFAYSTDGLNWKTMIDGIGATEAVYEHAFSAPLSGQIHVRVVDTNRSQNEPTLDTVSIDEMYFLTQTGPVLPNVTIAATDAHAAEELREPGSFTVTRTGDTADPLIVNYTVGGTASAADYSEMLTGSVTIRAGSESAVITVTPIDELLEEGGETVVLTLTADTAYTVGSSSSDAVTIADNDASQRTFYSTDTPKTIFDKKNPRPTLSQLTIESTGIVVGDLEVDLSIAHTSPDQLRGYLLSPAGTRVAVFESVGSIPTGYTDLGFVGESLDGVWIIELWDDVYGIGGTLGDWSLTVTPEGGGEMAAATAEGQWLILAAVDAALSEAGPADGDDDDASPPVDGDLLYLDFDVVDG